MSLRGFLRSEEQRGTPDEAAETPEPYRSSCTKGALARRGGVFGVWMDTRARNFVEEVRSARPTMVEPRFRAKRAGLQAPGFEPGARSPEPEAIHKREIEVEGPSGRHRQALAPVLFLGVAIACATTNGLESGPTQGGGTGGLEAGTSGSGSGDASGGFEDGALPPVTGSCNPAFCAGGCCIGPNGPCGRLEGTECVAPNACVADGCPTQFGEACCAASTGPCGLDLGGGCVAASGVPAAVPPPPAPGDPVSLYGSCGLPPEPGPCGAATTAYAWVPALRTCAPFPYGGCEGNSNRFDSESACIDECGHLARVIRCSCADDAAACDTSAGCSECPAHFHLEPSIQDMACTTPGLYCDSGEPCGVFCECVADGSGAAAWACATRLC
jgi:hypothetical protein